jgi:hypothetical protein
MALADSDLDALIAATPAKAAGGDDIDHLIATTPAKTGGLESLRRGATQGATLGFGDEITGAISAPILKAIGKFSGTPAYQNAFADKSLGELYDSSRDRERQANAAAQKDNPGTYLAGELGGSVLSSFAPGASALNVGREAGVGEALAKGARLGAITGIGNSDASTLGGTLRDAALGAGVGGFVGGVAHGVASGFGKLGSYATGKVAAIDEDVARAAAKDAAKVTGTAKSTLGGVTQDANRTVENLMRLEQSMTPEQRELYAALEQTGTLPALKEKLAQTGLEKVPGAAGRIDTATQALEEAATSEPQRAAALADQRLSGDALRQQVYARLKRYGLPAVGGAVLGGMGFGAHGALTGAALGGALGNNFRPMMHSLIRMGRSPVVQRAAFGALSGVAGRAAPAVESLGARATQSIEGEALPAARAASENFLNAFPQLKAAVNGPQQPNEALGANP